MPLRTLLPALLPLSFLSAAGCAREWKDFTPEGFKFKVVMPGTPQEQTQSASGVSVKMWSAEDGNGRYTVAVADVPGVGTGAGELRQRLDAARDGFIREVSGTLSKEEKITLEDKYPGRAFEAELPDKKNLRARLYFVEGRLYQLLAVGSADFTGSADTDRFLGSLQLTDRSAPAKGADVKRPESKGPAPKEVK